MLDWWVNHGFAVMMSAYAGIIIAVFLLRFPRNNGNSTLYYKGGVLPAVEYINPNNSFYLAWKSYEALRKEKRQEDRKKALRLVRGRSRNARRFVAGS